MKTLPYTTLITVSLFIAALVVSGSYTLSDNIDRGSLLASAELVQSETKVCGYEVESFEERVYASATNPNQHLFVGCGGFLE